jgi:ArsR family transcriptional regulator, virulence genes transcriptional regulator
MAAPHIERLCVQCDHGSTLKPFICDEDFPMGYVTLTPKTPPKSLGSKPESLVQLEQQAALATRLMKLVANEQRLLLLCKLTKGECPVGDLATYASLGLSATSQHLSKLRAEEVVATRRDAQTIYYRLVDPAAIRIIETLCDIYQH